MDLDQSRSLKYLVGNLFYFVYIPQLALVYYGLDKELDLKDCLILCYIHTWSNNLKAKFIKIGQKKYIWLNYKHLISSNPLLKIKNKSALAKRTQKLEKLGLIEKYQTPENSLYVRLTDLANDIYDYRFDEQDLETVIPEHNRVLCENEQGVMPQHNSTINNLNKESIKNHKYKSTNFKEDLKFDDWVQLEKHLEEKALKETTEDIPETLYYDPEFNRVYEAYPNKSGKLIAYSKWYSEGFKQSMTALGLTSDKEIADLLVKTTKWCVEKYNWNANQCDSIPTLDRFLQDNHYKKFLESNQTLEVCQ